MIRFLRVVAALVLIGAAPLQLSIRLQRDGFDLLDVTGIQIVVHDPASTQRTLRFGGPQEFAIDVLRGAETVWTLPVAAIPSGQHLAGHERSLQRGANVLATYEWDGLTAQRSTPLPGTYTIRVRVLAEPQLSAETSVRFIPPVPAAAIPKLQPGDVVTVAGTLDATGAVLADSTGAIALSRHIPAGMAATTVVRGAIVVQPDGTRALDVQRWAPMAASKPQQ